MNPSLSICHLCGHRDICRNYTESSLVHWIQRESGMPSALAFAFRALLFSFILNTASKNAAAAFEIGTSGPCVASLSSTLLLEISSSSSSLVLFWGGRVRLAKSVLLDCMLDPNYCGSAPFCMALRFSVVNSSCIDLILIDSVCKVFCNSLLLTIHTKQQLLSQPNKKPMERDRVLLL